MYDYGAEVRITACRRQGAFLFDSCGGTSDDAFEVARDGERWPIALPAAAAADTFYAGPFEVSVPPAGDDGARYIFAWRHGDDVSAEGSTVTMPLPFTITAPAPDVTLRANQEVRVAWQPASAEPSRWWAQVCGVPDPLFSGGYDVPAGADAIVIPADKFLVPPGRRCEVELLVERSREGGLSPRLEGGSIVATRAKRVRFYVENVAPTTE